MALKAATLLQNKRKIYAYQLDSEDEQSPRSKNSNNMTRRTFSHIDSNEKANNQSYALTLKCGFCDLAPILAVFMKEGIRERDMKREFMSFVISQCASNVFSDEKLIRKY